MAQKCPAEVNYILLTLRGYSTSLTGTFLSHHFKNVRRKTLEPHLPSLPAAQLLFHGEAYDSISCPEINNKMRCICKA